MNGYKNYFTELNKVDCSSHVEHKGQFSYLSWTFAVQELKNKHPNATWEVKRFSDRDFGCLVPYMKTSCGYFVEVEVDIDGVKMSQIHPVLDNRNKPISQPNSFQINTSIQRCLVKAIALHGLGLYIYAGEDLPPIEKDQAKLDQIASLNSIEAAREFYTQLTPAEKQLYLPDFEQQKMKLQNTGGNNEQDLS